MAHVLVVPAGELRDPVVLGVPVVTDNRLFHATRPARHNHMARGQPATTAPITSAVVTTHTPVENTNHGTISATPTNAASITNRTGPGVLTPIQRLSPGVEHTAGTPTNTTRVGSAHQPGAAIAADSHAINSVRKRKPAPSGVSTEGATGP